MFEIEGKILDVNVGKIKKKLSRIGANVVFTEQKFETIVFKLPQLNKKGGLYLRLRRRVGKKEGVLTYKSPKRNNGYLKKRFEQETIVNFEEMRTILERLGFVSCLLQEYKREEWKFKKSKIEIDIRPGVPPYIEIEGIEKDIYELTKLLGFEKKDLHPFSMIDILKYYKAL